MNCPTGKRRYEHKRDAKRALGMLRQIPGMRARTRAYRCDACGWWHLGGKPTMERIEELRGGRG